MNREIQASSTNWNLSGIETVGSAIGENRSPRDEMIDFIRARVGQRIGLKHLLAVQAKRLSCEKIELALVTAFAHKNLRGKLIDRSNLFGATLGVAGDAKSLAGRPRLAICLKGSLLYLKHVYNFSDEEVVECGAWNVVWQYCTHQAYYEPKPPCDATQVGCSHTAVGEAGLVGQLKAPMDTAVTTKAALLTRSWSI